VLYLLLAWRDLLVVLASTKVSVRECVSLVLTVVVYRDVRNGFFKFGSVLRKTVGSVRFLFDFEKSSVRFGLLCRSSLAGG